MPWNAMWRPDLPVVEHLRRVRVWGGPERWIASLDRAEEILVPHFAQRTAYGRHLQDAAPGIALQIYLISAESDCEPHTVSVDTVTEAFPSMDSAAGTRKRHFEDGLQLLGHGVHDFDHEDPVVRTWYGVLLSSQKPPPNAAPAAYDSDAVIGRVLDTTLPMLIAELQNSR